MGSPVEYTQSRFRVFLKFDPPKTIQNFKKSTPEPSKIKSRGLQNRVRRPPRRYFYKTFNLRSLRGGCILVFFRQHCQLGSNSMCFARTTALQVNASRDFWQQSLHHVQKSFESYAKSVFFSCVRHVPMSIKHRKNCGFVA